MSTISSNKLKSKLNKMATTGKKRKRRVTKAVTRRRRRTTATAPVKRRRRSLGSGGASGRMSLMKAGKNTIGGAIGGGIYSLPSFFIGLPWWAKLAWGISGSVTMNMLGFNHAGAGQAGAMVNDLARTQFGLMDGDLSDTQYVDPSTLSDTGFEDEMGDAVMMDDDGNVYALNDDGDYQKIGMSDDLPMNDSNSNVQGVSMLPLTDAYSLQEGNGYALASGY